MDNVVGFINLECDEAIKDDGRDLMREELNLK